jgi:hypothetical protein
MNILLRGQPILRRGLTLLLCALPLRAGTLSSADFVLTKTLPTTPGVANLTSASFSLAGAFGEPVSGQLYNSASFGLVPGYYAGFFGAGGTFSLVSSRVGDPGSKPFMQDGLQIGVPLNAAIHLDFSAVVAQNPDLVGVTVQLLSDHLGQSPSPAPFAAVVPAYNTDGHELVLSPPTAWQGNTLYDVELTPDLLSNDGFSLDKPSHIQFLTVLDPSVDNVVIHPNVVQAAAATAQGLAAGAVMNIHIPAQALSAYSFLQFNKDPLHAPLQTDPATIEAANQKAQTSGGPYRAPIAYEEIVAYDLNGNPTSALANAGSLSVSYNAPQGTVQGAPLVRSRTLSLWVLDSQHQLWVKMGSTKNDTAAGTLSAPISRLTLFALMGEADNSTSAVNVFPVPWRPHGPKAGTGSGQTGTEADGLIFNNLPSECTIRIYTLAGEKVRELRHSEALTLIPQERWDGKTSSGDPVASGVYLWRVEAGPDAKNGKLMIIR